MAKWVIDPDDMAKSSVEVVIDVSGIYTGIRKRDDHLRSPDFFDVEKCPQITYEHSRVPVREAQG